MSSRQCSRQGLSLTAATLFLLAGFFQATTLSTVLGQTGDWDILASAGLVALTELAGVCLYKSSSYPFFKESKIRIVKGIELAKSPVPGWAAKAANMWKIGLMYGLFVDGFKLGS
nr:hypothetical chloroplast RF20 [Klebsormidium sp. TAA2-JRJ3pt]WKT07834.1 hypothetical chloroplast RF20 [Klebsormidium sp. TAA2-JRJ3pt]